MPAFGKKLKPLDIQALVAYVRSLFSASLGAVNTKLADPVAAQRKTIFEDHSCNACHGEGGVGSAAAPALVGESAKRSSVQRKELFAHPTAKFAVTAC